MTAISEDDIWAALAELDVPNTDKNILEKNMVNNLILKDRNVSFVIEINPSEKEIMEPLRRAAETKILGLPGISSATVALTAHKTVPNSEPNVNSKETNLKRELAPDVKWIVAVASGKGGVGKSTTAVNLALSMEKTGLSVGLLDADIYGPSIPRMLNIKGKPKPLPNKQMAPMEKYGIKVMSIGFLIDEETPMIWRGPMVMGALEQMLRDVDWGEIDILVVDMPPGTGDAQLTMAQRVPLAGAVIVSTPQDIALIDARKGLNMFRKVNVPVLGIIENMSTFLCPNCGHRTDIFGHGGAQIEAERLGCGFLGEIPLELDIRVTSDIGEPVVISQPESSYSNIYNEIANKIIHTLSGEPLRVAPKIVMD